MEFKLGELFCGAGGIGYAATNTKVTCHDGDFIINHAWATDYNKDACITYANNIADASHSGNSVSSVICNDVRSLDFNQLSEIDALAFGFPCNDFSLVGEQKGTDGNFGGLYTY
ncbi:MAG: DNA cytosine methyltransferase, partial [Methylococcales bacterium]